MQKRSALWKRLAASGSAKLEAKAVIDGAEYPEILNPSVSASMCPDALSAAPYQVPAYATGTVMPYEVVAEIRRSADKIQANG